MGTVVLNGPADEARYIRKRKKQDAADSFSAFCFLTLLSPERFPDCLLFPDCAVVPDTGYISQSKSRSKAARAMSGFTRSPWKSLPPVAWIWYFSVRER